MRLWLRLTLELLVVCSILVVGAVLIGDGMNTTTTLYTAKMQTTVYIDYIMDMARRIILPLGGTRCFTEPAYQYYIAAYEAGQTDMEWSFPEYQMNAVDAVARLACLRDESSR